MRRQPAFPMIVAMVGIAVLASCDGRVILPGDDCSRRTSGSGVSSFCDDTTRAKIARSLA